MRNTTDSGLLIPQAETDTVGYSKVVTAAIKQFFGKGKDLKENILTRKSSFGKSTQKEDLQNDTIPYRIGRAFFCFGTKP